MHVFEKYHNEILRKVTTRGEPDIRFATLPCLEMLESLCNIFSRCIMHRFFQTQKRSSAIAATARVTARSGIAVDRLTVTVTLNMTQVKFCFTNESCQYVEFCFHIARGTR